MEQAKFGIVFDIDGVLMCDGVKVPEVDEMFNLLHDAKTNDPMYPYVFVTNNGGFSELEKAKKVSMVLDRNIDQERVMVAHTPMKALADKFRDSAVLIVARKHETAVNLSKWYGFENYTSIQEYVEKRPFLFPTKYSKFWTMGQKNDYALKEESPETRQELPYKAILMFEEPADWAETIQVMSDVLQSQDGLISLKNVNKASEQAIELHVANPDFCYGGEFVLPRYTMGAFIQCLSSLFKTSTGQDLKVTFYGKPYDTTYMYAKELMATQLKKLNQLPPKHIYAIGDNPLSDIMGANRLEKEGWMSVLVKTGVFKGEGNDIDNPAKYVCNNVLDAIKLILELEVGNSPNSSN
eukprot:gene16162-19235_t